MKCDLKPRCKYLQSAIVALLLIFVIPSHAQQLTETVSFPDVPRHHWAFEAINRITNAGLIEGKPSGRFEGDAPITRYEFGVAVARIMERIGWRGEISVAFTDVSKGHYSHEALKRVVFFGIMRGLPDGKFGGAQPMTRAAAALAFARILQISDEFAANPRAFKSELAPMILPDANSSIMKESLFFDVARSHWAWAAIQRVALGGIVEGESNDFFRPEKPLKRYDFVVMTLRALERNAVCRIDTSALSP